MILMSNDPLRILSSHNVSQSFKTLWLYKSIVKEVDVLSCF